MDIETGGISVSQTENGRNVGKMGVAVGAPTKFGVLEGLAAVQSAIDSINNDQGKLTMSEWNLELDSIEEAEEALKTIGAVDKPVSKITLSVTFGEVESEPEEDEHVCEDCGRSFPTGNALGGHRPCSEASGD